MDYKLSRPNNTSHILGWSHYDICWSPKLLSHLCPPSSDSFWILAWLQTFCQSLQSLWFHSIRTCSQGQMMPPWVTHHQMCHDWLCGRYQGMETVGSSSKMYSYQQRRHLWWIPSPTIHSWQHCKTDTTTEIGWHSWWQCCSTTCSCASLYACHLPWPSWCSWQPSRHPFGSTRLSFTTRLSFATSPHLTSTIPSTTCTTTCQCFMKVWTCPSSSPNFMASSKCCPISQSSSCSLSEGSKSGGDCWPEWGGGTGWLCHVICPAPTVGTCQSQQCSRSP